MKCRMADCATMLQALLHNAEATTKMLQKHDVISACIQASETEHAARIGATATRQAANWGLLTGFSALGAAGIAYVSVRMQIRLTESQNRARRIAYQRHFGLLVAIFKIEVISLLIRLQEADENILRKEIKKSTPFLVRLRDEISTINWDRHALLGESVSKQIAYTSMLVEFGFQSVDFLLQSNILIFSKSVSSSYETFSELELQLTNLSTALEDSVPKPKISTTIKWLLSLRLV